MSSPAAPAANSVVRYRDGDTAALAALLARFGLSIRRSPEQAPIPGSFWGDEEAGLLGDCLVLRSDTPLHSILHEACHYICMDASRRSGLDTDAGGDYDEENAVCYLQILLAGLLPAHTPSGYSNGQYVVDPTQYRRGPFSDPVAPHSFLVSPFHRSSEMCGTCHDVSNPAFDRVAGADYAPGPLDQPADSVMSHLLMPLERTYSEWKNSAYPAGVYAPDFAGNKSDGIVASCQDCHLRDVAGYGCNDPAAPLRPDLPLHDMMGGNAWMPSVVAALYPGETNATALANGAARAVSMLQKAARVDVAVVHEGDSARADITVTNRTGHKLPTGYPEGRRAWLHVVARDEGGAVVYESGAWDPATGVLAPAPVIYETHLGISPALGSAIGMIHGPTFHFVLNDTIYKDNRIPPQGFTNAAFAVFGGQPVDHDVAGLRYVDGQNWDVTSVALPASARSVYAEMLYQTMSKDYLDFLVAENTTNNAGQTLYDAWVAHGRAAPVWMPRRPCIGMRSDVGSSPRRGSAHCRGPRGAGQPCGLRLFCNACGREGGVITGR